ncbi:GAF domain-containing protein [Actinoplanes awajinensis]|uniref:Histidine kinase n=1 Tax=Actinoplanes awajinensis subsp. mycoplanecinus TaxID=135947 RepID=A0A101J9U4_9ACTN|nr:GAF domain-containing protein [Actinoplanes awajinensis]KUL22829.1 histidine kinase [Actinoplanes awajinensis subsp. mycoplanecinus]
MNLKTNTDLFSRLGEPARMQRLAGYDLFDTGMHRQLDRIAARSAARLQAPVSMVSILLDSAQFIIGHHGLPDTAAQLQGTPAEWALCTRTVLAGSPYCLTNSDTDPQHADNPIMAITGLRSYAGVPLRDDTGQILGAHCVLDAAPRRFTELDVAMLSEAAVDTMRILEQYRVS